MEQPSFSHARTLQGHSRAVASVKFSPGSGELLATAAADQTVRLWNHASGQEVRQLQGHTQGISDVCWSPGGQYLCTASDDHSLKFWDVETGTCLRTLQGHTNFVFCCSFSPQGNVLASGSFDETLRMWDVRSSTCLREVPAHSDPITAVDFSHDGTLLVTSSLDGLCRLWDAATGHCLKTLFDKDSPPVSFVRFTPNARHILSSSLDGRIRLWDYEHGRAIRVYEGHANQKFCITCALCGPSGRPQTEARSKDSPAGPAPWVVTGSEDGKLFVYDLNDQKALQIVEGGEAGQGAHADAVLCVDVHPSQPLLATCSQGMNELSGSVKIWAHGGCPTAMDVDTGGIAST